jgi:hypothetical protein
MSDHDQSQRHSTGSVPIILSPEEQQKAQEERERAAEVKAAQAHREADESYKNRQLELMESGNRQTAAYVRLTLALALLSFVGLIATFYQGHLAKRNADSAQTSAEAAKSAATTAKATLDEMQNGQGAQDTHKLADAAGTQAEASKKSARAAESAANTAKATLEVQSSPWLGIEKDEADFDPPGGFQRDGSIELTFTIRLHNYGSAPARDVSIYVPQKAEGGKYSRGEFFHQSNVCTEPDQAKRDVEAQEPYGVEHIVWPSDHRDFPLTIKTFKSPASYFPGCISYKGRSDSFRHTLFFYRTRVDINPADPTPAVPKVRGVTLLGIEPLQ